MECPRGRPQAPSSPALLYLCAPIITFPLVTLSTLTHQSGPITVPPHWPTGLLSSPSQFHSYLSVPLFLQLSGLFRFKFQLSHFTMMWPGAKVSICLCFKVLMYEIDIIMGPPIMLGHIRPFATLWIVACQAPLSMEFLRQEYWSGLPFPTPGDLPDPGIKPASFMSPALAGEFFNTCAI